MHMLYVIRPTGWKYIANLTTSPSKYATNSDIVDFLTEYWKSFFNSRLLCWLQVFDYTYERKIQEKLLGWINIAKENGQITPHVRHSNIYLTSDWPSLHFLIVGIQRMPDELHPRQISSYIEPHHWWIGSNTGLQIWICITFILWTSGLQNQLLFFSAICNRSRFSMSLLNKIFAGVCLFSAW